MSGPKMYNLNVNVSTSMPGGLLPMDPQCTTPRTPEILNSLIAMTNPFDNLGRSSQNQLHSPGSDDSSSRTGSPFASPANSPPSVQHTCSQLIKEGLKLTIQTKRKMSGSETSKEDEDHEGKRSRRDELTAEDEERRKRRRERNKIAATKCRMKKREKTANLVGESEVLESQNVELKSQIQELEKQRRKLMEMLSQHTPHCVKGTAQATVDIDIEEVTPVFDCLDFQLGNNSFGRDPNFARPYNTFPTSTDTSQYYLPKVKNKDDKKHTETEVYRVQNFRCNEDLDSYRPNGMVDNFFTVRSDNVFVTDYTSFGNNVMDSSCMA